MGGGFDHMENATFNGGHIVQQEQIEVDPLLGSPLGDEEENDNAERAKYHETRFDNVSRKFWEPIWIRGSTLIACATAFATTALGILALYIVANRLYGLGSYAPDSGLVYLWKYIPSAGKDLTDLKLPCSS